MRSRGGTRGCRRWRRAAPQSGRPAVPDRGTGEAPPPFPSCGSWQRLVISTLRCPRVRVAVSGVPFRKDTGQIVPGPPDSSTTSSRRIAAARARFANEVVLRGAAARPARSGVTVRPLAGSATHAGPRWPSRKTPLPWWGRGPREAPGRLRARGLGQRGGNSMQQRMGALWGGRREDRCSVSVWLCELCLLPTARFSEPLKTPIKLTSTLRNRKVIFFFFYGIYCSDLPPRPGKRHPLRRHLASGVLGAVRRGQNHAHSGRRPALSRDAETTCCRSRCALLRGCFVAWVHGRRKACDPDPDSGHGDGTGHPRHSVRGASTF